MAGAYFLVLVFPMPLEPHALAIFLAAVTVSAWYGGLGPGLLSTALSGLALAHISILAAHSLSVTRADIIRLGVFTPVAVLVSSLNVARGRAQAALRTARDDLERRVAERAASLADAYEGLAALIGVGRRLTRGLELPRVLDTIAEAAAVVCKGEAAFRLVEGEVLVRAGATAGALEAMPRERLRIGESVSGRVALTGKPIMTPDIAADPRVIPEHRVRRDDRVGAVLCVPIRVETRILGTLNIYRERGHRFNDREMTLALGLADQAGTAISNARLFEDVERRRQEAEAVAELTRAISATLDLDAVLELVAEHAKALCRSDFALIALRTPDAAGMTFQHRPGACYEHYDTIKIEPGRGAGGQVLTTGRPFRTTNYAEDPRITKDYLPAARAEGVVALLVVPIRTDGEIEGLLYVVNRAARAYTDHDDALLTRLADHAAIAIRNARLFAREQAARTEAEATSVRFETLTRLVQAITVPLELHDVLKSVALAAIDMVPDAAAQIWVVEDDRLVLREEAGMRSSAAGAPAEVPLREGGIGRVATTRKPVVIDDLDADATAPDRDRRRREVLVSFVGIPLLVRDRLVGVLCLLTRHAHQVGQRELDILTSFSTQAAIAIDHARLYKELRTALMEVEASQQRLVQTERLKALGEMAAGVAHDFNNVLAVILGRSELLLRRVRDPEIVSGLEIVCAAAWDGAQTVRRIQEFARTRTAQPFGRVDLLDLLRQVVDLTRQRWSDEAQSRGITYEVRVEGTDAASVAGVIEELREVFVNLLINALEAMPEGGRVTLRVTTETEHVTVTVEDTGCGMSEEIRARVFEPFFTTKGPRGTGLGLALAWGAITRHGGTIGVESAVGVGSTVRIRLPISTQFVSASEPDRQPLPRASGRVLVIDDETEVRMVLRDLLVEHGYTVLEAADGASGLAKCETGPVDLMLCDISLPGMSGWEVAEAYRTRFPDRPFGFVTGWGDHLDPDQLRHVRANFVLAKPFQAGDVLWQVARALGIPNAPDKRPT